MSFEFGPGNLTTTDNAGWRGTDLITFAPIFDPDEGPVTVEIKGLKAHARGLYRVQWDNLFVTGVLRRDVLTATGGGRLIPIGTAQTSTLIPKGGEARFSFVTVNRGAGHTGAAQFRYRTPGIDLISAGSNWVLLDSSSVSLAGDAFVNGAGGYQYEMRGSDGRTSDAGARLSVRIWTTPHSIHRPTYVGFGRVAEGGIRLWVP